MLEGEEKRKKKAPVPVSGGSRWRLRIALLKRTSRCSIGTRPILPRLGRNYHHSSLSLARLLRWPLAPFSSFSPSGPKRVRPLMPLDSPALSLTNAALFFLFAPLPCIFHYPAHTRPARGESACVCIVREQWRIGATVPGEEEVFVFKAPTCSFCSSIHTSLCPEARQQYCPHKGLFNYTVLGELASLMRPLCYAGNLALAGSLSVAAKMRKRDNGRHRRGESRGSLVRGPR